MTPEQLKNGKERVRKHLVEPMSRMRFKKPRKCRTEMAWVAEIGEMQLRLAHLSTDDLEALCSLVVENADPKGEWPAPAMVIGLGNRFAPRADIDSPRVVNLIRWAAGKAEIDNELLYLFYDWLRRHRHMPSDFDWRSMATTLRNDQDTLARAETLRLEGREPSSELAMDLARIRTSKERVRVILAEVEVAA